MQESLKDAEERHEEDLKEAKEKLDAVSKEHQQQQQKQQLIANEDSDHSPEVGGDTPVAPKAFVE